MNASIQSLSAMEALGSSAQAPRVNKTTNAEKALEVAEQFEAFILGQFLQPMFSEASDSASPFGGGPGEDAWRSLQVDEYGNAIARSGGIGIADAIYQQILMLQEV
jgi:peptidoglycan hydrolase FlgJ